MTEVSKQPAPPDRIWLQWEGADSEDILPSQCDIEPLLGDVTWCKDRQFDTDVEYVRAAADSTELREAANGALELINTLMAEAIMDDTDLDPGEFAKLAALRGVLDRREK